MAFSEARIESRIRYGNQHFLHTSSTPIPHPVRTLPSSQLPVRTGGAFTSTSGQLYMCTRHWRGGISAVSGYRLPVVPLILFRLHRLATWPGAESAQVSDRGPYRYLDYSNLAPTFRRLQLIITADQVAQLL